MKPDLYNCHTAYTLRQLSSRRSLPPFPTSPRGIHALACYASLGTKVSGSAPRNAVAFAMPVTSQGARRTIDESTTTSNVRDLQNIDPTTAGPYPNELSKIPHSLDSPSENANKISLSQSHFTPLANSPMNVDNLEMQLLSHPDRWKVHYLITGLPEGFRVSFHSDNVTLM